MERRRSVSPTTGTIGDGPLGLSLTASRFEWAERRRASRRCRARPRGGRCLGDSGRSRQNFRVDKPETAPAILRRALETACLRLSPWRSRGRTQWSRRSAAIRCSWPWQAGLLESRRVVTHHLGMEILVATRARSRPQRECRRRESRQRTRSSLRARRRPPLDRATVGPANSARRLFEYERRGIVWRDHGPTPMSLA